LVGLGGFGSLLGMRLSGGRVLVDGAWSEDGNERAKGNEDGNRRAERRERRATKKETKKHPLTFFKLNPFQSDRITNNSKHHEIVIANQFRRRERV